jgi:membrane protein DedA with SNARE-associated domain
MNVALGGWVGGSVLDVSASAGPVAIAMGLIAVGVLVASAGVLLVTAWRRRGA